MDNDNVTMTIIVEPSKSQGLTVLFKEGGDFSTPTYELDLEEVDIDGLTDTLLDIQKLIKKEKVGKVTFEHILGSEKD